MKKRAITLTLVCASALTACAPSGPHTQVIPAIEYVNKLKASQPFASKADSNIPVTTSAVAYRPGTEEPKAQIRLVDGSNDAPAEPALKTDQPQGPMEDVVTNLDHPANDGARFEGVSQNVRDYNGPLSLGDPGLTSSLWRESRGGNNIFQDDRAWQPMDLLTIIISESDSSTRQAKTDNKSETSIKAAISSLLGLDGYAATRNDKYLDPSNLIDATSSTEFKGEGKTDRKGTLKAKMSAMVAEVLPSGVLRIEGKKIVAVNGEEQIMVISGLVRPKDITSPNEVDSSKIANMRIDYYGRGDVDDASRPGWGTSLILKLWPF